MKMTLEEAWDSGVWDNIVDVLYDKIMEKIYQQTLKDLNITDEKRWFVETRLNPYIKKRFRYHLDWR